MNQILHAGAGGRLVVTNTTLVRTTAGWKWADELQDGDRLPRRTAHLPTPAPGGSRASDAFFYSSRYLARARIEMTRTRAGLAYGFLPNQQAEPPEPDCYVHFVHGLFSTTDHPRTSRPDMILAEIIEACGLSYRFGGNRVEFAKPAIVVGGRIRGEPPPHTLRTVGDTLAPAAPLGPGDHFVGPFQIRIPDDT